MTSSWSPLFALLAVSAATLAGCGSSGPSDDGSPLSQLPHRFLELQLEEPDRVVVQISWARPPQSAGACPRVLPTIHAALNGRVMALTNSGGPESCTGAFGPCGCEPVHFLIDGAGALGAPDGHAELVVADESQTITLIARQALLPSVIALAPQQGNRLARYELLMVQLAEGDPRIAVPPGADLRDDLMLVLERQLPKFLESTEAEYAIVSHGLLRVSFPLSSPGPAVLQAKSSTWSLSAQVDRCDGADHCSVAGATNLLGGIPLVFQ
jgi:hypothetical protein